MKVKLAPSEAEFQSAVVDLAELAGWRSMHVRRSVVRGNRWATTTSVAGWPVADIANEVDRSVSTVYRYLGDPMTNPAITALLDQVLAADRRIAGYLKASTGTAETCPNLSPTIAGVLAAMFDQISEAYQLGQPLGCPHLQGAADMAIWFPWAAGVWLCEACALDLANMREGLACDDCGAGLTPDAVHLTNVHIPGHVAVIDGGPVARGAPPTLAKILLCSDCRAPNGATTNDEHADET